MKITNMNTLTTTLGKLSALALTVAVTGFATAGYAQDKRETTQERIGVYDSRAIAVAYAGSSWQRDKMKDLQAQRAKAKEGGDTKEVARLEAEGQAWQQKLHQQGFGTAPVDDLLACIEGELPKIKESAGVSGLTSKWNDAELTKHRKATQVDVTTRLVDAFHPDAVQRKRALEIQKTKPQKIKG